MTNDPMAETAGDLSLEELVDRIQHLLGVIEGYSDPTIKRAVFDLLDWLDVLHREALERLVAGLKSVGFYEKAIDDQVIAHVLAIYDLIDVVDPEPLVEQALDEVRSYIHSHGGEMKVASIEGGVVSMTMMGACAGCPSSVVTLTQSLEKAVRERWPGLVRIEVDEQPGDQWQSVSIRAKG